MNKTKIVNIFIVGIVYFFLSCASEFLFEPQHAFFTIRLAPGFGLVATLICGMPAIAGVLLGEFAYYYFLHYANVSTLVLCVLATNASLYVFIENKLLQRYIQQPNHLEKSSDFVKFFLLGGFTASFIPSVIAVFSLSLIEPAIQQSFGLLTVHWWFGQILGVLVISPLALCIMWKAIPLWKTRIPLVPVFMSMLIVIISLIYTYVTNTEKEKLDSLLGQKSQLISVAIKLQMSNYEESRIQLTSATDGLIPKNT